MYLSFLATVVLSIASVARAVNVDKESCKRKNPWAPQILTGMPWESNPESFYFCEAGYIDGNVLTGLRMWKGVWSVWGLQFQWGNLEWGRVYGCDLGPGYTEVVPHQASLEWNPEDNVEIKMKHAKNGHGRDSVGWIQITVNGVVKFDDGAEKIEDQWVGIDSGAGKIVGLQGMSEIITGDNTQPVRTLEFMFIEADVDSSSMTDIKFTEDINAWNSLKKGINLNASIAEAWYVNDNAKGGVNQTFSNALNAKITHSQRFETTRTNGFGITIGAKTAVKAKAPFLAEAKVDGSLDLKWDFIQSDMNGTTDEKSIDFSFTQGAQFITGVPPQSATNCTITAHEGTFISDYIATISTALGNGKRFTFYERGILTTVAFTNAVSRCQTIPLADMPKVINGETIKGKDVQTGDGESAAADGEVQGIADGQAEAAEASLPKRADEEVQRIADGQAKAGEASWTKRAVQWVQGIADGQVEAAEPSLPKRAVQFSA